MSTSLSIGEFSRATHLTVKALRPCPEAGLRVPASLDPGTGYRRYTAEQISLAQIIRRFRGLEMPVGEIRAVLATSDLAVRNELIATHLRRLEAELSRTQDAVASLRDILEQPAKDHRIERRRIEPAPAAALRDTMRARDAMSWFGGAMAELVATVKAQKLGPTGVPGGLFANSLFSHGRGEATLF